MKVNETAKKNAGWGLTALYNLRLTILMFHAIIFQLMPGKIKGFKSKELKVNFIERKNSIKVFYPCLGCSSSYS